jgi:hypothetical protein
VPALRGARSRAACSCRSHCARTPDRRDRTPRQHMASRDRRLRLPPRRAPRRVPRPPLAPARAKHHHEPALHLGAGSQLGFKHLQGAHIPTGGPAHHPRSLPLTPRGIASDDKKQVISRNGTGGPPASASAKAPTHSAANAVMSRVVPEDVARPSASWLDLDREGEIAVQRAVDHVAADWRFDHLDKHARLRPPRQTRATSGLQEGLADATLAHSLANLSEDFVGRVRRA